MNSFKILKNDQVYYGSFVSNQTYNKGNCSVHLISPSNWFHFPKDSQMDLRLNAILAYADAYILVDPRHVQNIMHQLANCPIEG